MRGIWGSQVKISNKKTPAFLHGVFRRGENAPSARSLKFNQIKYYHFANTSQFMGNLIFRSWHRPKASWNYNNSNPAKALGALFGAKIQRY
jgi:hypothetical protein